MKLRDIPPTVWLIGGGAIAAYIAFRYLRGGIATAANAINPLNDNNIFTTGQHNVNEAVFGADPRSSVGSDLYDAVQWWKWKFGLDYDATALQGYSNYTPELPESSGSYSGYPGGTSYPSRTGVQDGYNTDPYIPDVIKQFGA